jgi:lactoylglutathione lyase
MAGRNFGHLAYQVDDIYATCQQLLDKDVTLNRPPRDGRMAFIRSPDGISIELLQSGGRAAAAGALAIDGEYRRVVALSG